MKVKPFKLFALLVIFLVAASLLSACGTAKLTQATEVTKGPIVQAITPELDRVTISLNNNFTDAGGTLFYAVETNSNPSVVTVNVNDIANTLSMNFIGLGSSTITFTESDANGIRARATLIVDVTAPIIALSTNNSLTQRADVKLTVGSNFLANDTTGFSYGNFQNSNPSFVNVSVSGASMTLDFLGDGSTTISFDETDPDNVVRSATLTIVGESCSTPPTVASKTRLVGAELICVDDE